MHQGRVPVKVVLRRKEQSVTAALIRKTVTQEVMFPSGLEERIEYKGHGERMEGKRYHCTFQ